MRIKFSDHALNRMSERKIKKDDVEKFIKSPDKVEISNINKNTSKISKYF